jgi:ribosomal subunit interface protein
MNPRTADLDVVDKEAPAGFHFDVRTRPFDLTSPIYAYAREHIAAKLAKHARFLTEVVVRLDDVNGPKRGEDMRCHVEAVVAGHPPLVAEETNEDAHAAMDLAADRIERLVRRVVEERWTKQRQRGHKMVRNRKLMH